MFTTRCTRVARILRAILRARHGVEVTDASCRVISFIRGTARARGPLFRAPRTMRKRVENLSSSLGERT